MSKADRPDQPNASSRFNEETATYSVRGSEQPDLQAGVAAIRNVWKTLPIKPGVYRMHDARGDILYVGKARALKNRVSNYTQVDRLPQRLKRMVAQTRSMTIVTTNSEAEALLLEAQLIKRYRPAYNVLLRDDKSFPFILLRSDHKFPRIQKHRGARRHKGQYYGPFASAGSVNQTLNALEKLFLLRSCSDSFFNNRDRPCLLYQIKRCSAPCVGRIEDGAYSELVADAKSFLDGKSSGVQAKLAAEMEGAADALDFERAAMLRDRLKALTFIQGSQAINAQGIGDADIFALAHRNGVMGIQAFFIRGGQNWGHRSFFPAHVSEMNEDDVFTSFLAQFYEDVPPAKLILLDRELAEATLLAQALSARAERKVDGREIIRAIQAAAPKGMEVRVFVGMCHNDYTGAVKDVIDDAVNWPELTGLDLHGWEDTPLEPWTAGVWAKARAAGKFNKAHAGEFMPANFVTLVLDELKVKRIQHGCSAAEDPAVIARLVRDGVTLDMCPISNLKLQARGLKSLCAHPLRNVSRCRGVRDGEFRRSVLLRQHPHGRLRRARDGRRLSPSRDVLQARAQRLAGFNAAGCRERRHSSPNSIASRAPFN